MVNIEMSLSTYSLYNILFAFGSRFPNYHSDIDIWHGYIIRCELLTFVHFLVSGIFILMCVNKAMF